MGWGTLATGHLRPDWALLPELCSRPPVDLAALVRRILADLDSSPWQALNYLGSLSLTAA